MVRVFVTLLQSFSLMVATGSSCILQGPELQIVRPGDNATFQCQTDSSTAHWIINDKDLARDNLYGDPYLHFLLTRTSEGRFHNLTAIVLTSKNNSRGEISCACTDGALDAPVVTSNTVQWLTSCLVGMEDRVNLPSTLTVIPIPSSNLFMGMVEVQLPAVCLMEPIHYKLIAENTESFKNTSTEGSTEITSHLLKFTTSGLEKNLSYRLYLMAKTYTVQEWYLIDEWNAALSIAYKGQETSSTSFKGQETSSTSFNLVLIFLGILLLLLITTIGAVAGGLIVRKHKRKGRTTTRAMVNNPIYDGPMYESIHPQFRMVNQQSGTTVTGESESVKAEGESRESEHDTELSLPDELATPDLESSPRYVHHLQPHPKGDQDHQPADANSLTLSPAPTTPTQTPTQLEHRERNVLGLTLDLSETTRNGESLARGYDMGRNDGRQTRRRAATMSQTRPLLLSYLSSNSSTPSNDDNYTIMSPVTHVPVLTADGTSFLREEKRVYRDRCTTLI